MKDTNSVIAKLAQELMGRKLPTNLEGHAGREAENLLESFGLKINRGHGPDIEILGWELKTRKITATSAQTVTQMYAEDIISTPYPQSAVAEKIKKQLRITTNDDDVIIAVDLIDFDQPQIQDLIKEAYENGRKHIANNPDIGYTPYTGFWGYFEQCHLPKNAAYSFRLSDTDMDRLVAMSKSTFQNLFDYDNDN